MGLSPAVFWAMSLAEWRAAVEGRFGQARAPMARRDLDQLMQLYPDRSDARSQ
jgi:uncharacterized phage protein (TIGR02216 family)